MAPYFFDFPVNFPKQKRKKKRNDTEEIERQHQKFKNARQMAGTKQTKEKEDIQKTNLRRLNDKRLRHHRETTWAKRGGIIFLHIYAPPFFLYLHFMMNCNIANVRVVFFFEFENNVKNYTQCNICRVVSRQ